MAWDECLQEECVCGLRNSVRPVEYIQPIVVHAEDAEGIIH